MKSKSIVSFFILFFLLQGCCYPVRYDGPYKGKVVDVDTGKPIEGVVVLGQWSKVAVTPAGGVSSYYDAQERVTNKNGEFEIRGLGLKILSNVAPMNVLIFKVGYQYIGLGPWDSLKLDGGLLKKKVSWEGDKAIIPLRKLTIEERKEEGTFPPGPPGEAPLEKVILMLKEIDKEGMARGLPPRKFWDGKKYD